MDSSIKISQLKQALINEVGKEQSDNNLILALSNEIAKLDENLVRFSVDAGLISRLGKELVGKHETAVSELIKNAYDADADNVRLIFENAWEAGGNLIIEDNGCGMTKDQLINGFMRLSSSDKIHNPQSEKYQRTRAGRKGIGRFATQRLGSKLTIITQTASLENAIRIKIDWDEFKMDKDLLTVANEVQLIPKIKKEGTTLIIEDLREGWSDAMIKRVFRYTVALLQPFPLSKKQEEVSSNHIDPGFKSVYFRKNGNDLIPILDEEEAILKHALAEIEGNVDENGQGHWSVKSEKLNFPEENHDIGNNEEEREDISTPFNLIKGIHFKAYYFIYDANLFAPGTFTFIRNIAYETGGIRLYRNGFRVLPYGEQGDDWLGLDKSNNRSITLAPHANINFFGFIELKDLLGKFEETSSREGLIENDSQKELINFVYRSIVSAVKKIAEIRGRKATASQKKFKKTESPTEKVDSVVAKMEEILEKENNFNNNSSNESSDGSKKEFKEAFSEFKEARKQEKEERQQLIDENNMLRVLAGLGLVIGEFVHEVQRFLPGFDAEIVFLKNALKDYKEALDRTKLLEHNIKSFTAYTAYFDKAISRNVIRELQPIEIRDAIRDFKQVINSDLTRSKITLETPPNYEYDLFTVPMHPSEWASILFNLYTNSKKAIIRNQSQGRISIKFGGDNDNIYIEFSDNGDGIPVENEELIFNAFFTTTSAANHDADDAEMLKGTGLGLKIVKDIIEAYNGEIYVSKPVDGFMTTIRIEVPKYQKEND